MQRVGRLMLGNLAGPALLVGLVGVGVVAFASGGRMFSPGALNAQTHDNRKLGDVTSHAAIGGNCSACHAPPWSRDNMASRCLNCHTDVRDEIDTEQALHGRLSNGNQCRTCHSEHNGVHADLTTFARFDHDCTRFKLTGKHTAAECQSCHRDNQYMDTPSDCVGCHAEPPVPDVHKKRYGSNCSQCHTTTAFTGSSFKHSFPINHGRGRRGASDCATCHKEAPDNFASYTCYGCHEHNEDRIKRRHTRVAAAELPNCVHCHKGGRERERALVPDFHPDQLCLAGSEVTCTRDNGAILTCSFSVNTPLLHSLGGPAEELSTPAKRHDSAMLFTLPNLLDIRGGLRQLRPVTSP